VGAHGYSMIDCRCNIVKMFDKKKILTKYTTPTLIPVGLIYPEEFFLENLSKLLLV